MNNDRSLNVLSVCRYFSPLTVSVKPSAFSRKYGPIMRSNYAPQLRVVEVIPFHLNSWIFHSPISEVLFINETIQMEMCFIRSVQIKECTD